MWPAECQELNLNTVSEIPTICLDIEAAAFCEEGYGCTYAWLRLFDGEVSLRNQVYGRRNCDEAPEFTQEVALLNASQLDQRYTLLMPDGRNIRPN